MKNALSVIPAPSPLNTAVVPKPTKNEVLEALTIIRVEQLTKERNEKIKTRDAAVASAEKKLGAWVVKNARRLTPRVSLGSIWNTDLRYTEVEFKLEDVIAQGGLPKDLHEIILAAIALKEERMPSIDPKDVKAELRETMLGVPQDRIRALLDNKASRAVLDSMLTQLTDGEASKPVKNQ